MRSPQMTQPPLRSAVVAPQHRLVADPSSRSRLPTAAGPPGIPARGSTSRLVPAAHSSAPESSDANRHGRSQASRQSVQAPPRSLPIPLAHRQPPPRSRAPVHSGAGDVRLDFPSAETPAPRLRSPVPVAVSKPGPPPQTLFPPAVVSPSPPAHSRRYSGSPR